MHEKYIVYTAQLASQGIDIAHLAIDGYTVRVPIGDGAPDEIYEPLDRALIASRIGEELLASMLADTTYDADGRLINPWGYSWFQAIQDGDEAAIAETKALMA